MSQKNQKGDVIGRILKAKRVIERKNEHGIRETNDNNYYMERCAIMLHGTLGITRKISIYLTKCGFSENKKILVVTKRCVKRLEKNDI